MSITEQHGDRKTAIMALYILSTLCFVAISTAAEIVQLSIPDAPPAGSQTLSGSFQGYSMEIASFADMAGNLSYAETLTTY